MEIVGTVKISLDLKITQQTARRWLRNGRFGAVLKLVPAKKRKSLFIYHAQLVRFKIESGIEVSPQEESLVNFRSDFPSTPIGSDTERLVGQVEPGQPIL